MLNIHSSPPRNIALWLLSEGWAYKERFLSFSHWEIYCQISYLLYKVYFTSLAEEWFYVKVVLVSGESSEWPTVLDQVRNCSCTGSGPRSIPWYFWRHYSSIPGFIVWLPKVFAEWLNYECQNTIFSNYSTKKLLTWHCTNATTQTNFITLTQSLQIKTTMDEYSISFFYE